MASLLRFASEPQRRDVAVVRAALSQCGMALQHSAHGRRGIPMALIAVARAGLALQYASQAARASERVVRAAVERDGRALQYASDSLRGERALAVRAAAWCYGTGRDGWRRFARRLAKRIIADFQALQAGPRPATAGDSDEIHSDAISLCNGGELFAALQRLALAAAWDCCVLPAMARDLDVCVLQHIAGRLPWVPGLQLLTRWPSLRASHAPLRIRPYA